MKEYFNNGKNGSLYIVIFFFWFLYIVYFYLFIIFLKNFFLFKNNYLIYKKQIPSLFTYHHLYIYYNINSLLHKKKLKQFHSNQI